MSTKQNEQWLEAAKENFDSAIEEGNYALAKDIIADVMDVDLQAGRALSEELRNVPVEKFNIKSPIQPRDLC